MKPKLTPNKMTVTYSVSNLSTTYPKLYDAIRNHIISVLKDKKLTPVNQQQTMFHGNCSSHSLFLSAKTEIQTQVQSFITRLQHANPQIRIKGNVDFVFGWGVEHTKNV